MSGIQMSPQDNAVHFFSKGIIKNYKREQNETSKDAQSSSTKVNGVFFLEVLKLYELL
jgi:hypothetical protein